MFLKIKIRPDKKNGIQSMSDEELIRLYKKSKDNKYIGELFERYTHLVFGVCLKYLKNEDDSKDAVMEIFESLDSKLVKHEVGNFRKWIYMVAKNHCLMILRKTRNEVKVSDYHLENLTKDNVEFDPVFHQVNSDNTETMIDRMQKGIAQLKDKQRRCIDLLYLQNKSYKEVAEITGYDMKKVKSYIQNGKRNLRIYLEKK